MTEEAKETKQTLRDTGGRYVTGTLGRPKGSTNKNCKRVDLQAMAERYLRGESISHLAFDEGVSYSLLHSRLTKHFGTSLRQARKNAPVDVAIERSRKGRPQRFRTSMKLLRSVKLLLDTDLSYSDVGRTVGVCREYVGQLAENMLDAGLKPCARTVNKPSRGQE